MMSRRTTFARSLIKTGALLGSLALATPSAPAFADSGPQRVLYIFPGFTDDGGADLSGVASVVHCFNFSSVEETIQIVVRTSDGSIVKNTTATIVSFGTGTVASHDIRLYDNGTLNLETGAVLHGVLGISATSSNIVCTAQVMDAAASVPNGIDLHGARFNPISGSEE